MPYLHSSAEQGSEFLLSCSSPLAVSCFSEERVSMRRAAKVTFQTHIARVEHVIFQHLHML